MKAYRCFFCIVCIFIYVNCRADVKFVDFSKIDPSGQYTRHRLFLIDNLVYFDHWSPDWVYEIPKDSLIHELKTCLTAYEPLNANVYETDLLLGEIAHYLYNLDEKSYYDTAEDFYMGAIAANEKDCRGYWFLGYHYASSAEIKKGVEWFNKAFKLANDETGNDFWQEYAWAMELAGMPAHSRYALDKYLKNGGASLLSKIMDSTLKAETTQADPDISYKTRTLWTKDTSAKMMSFTSKPLGIQLNVNTVWDMQLFDYGNRMTAVSIKPPAFKSAKGTTIGCTIGVVIHPAKDGEQLKDFMTAMMKTNGTKDAVFALADRYPKGLSYTVRTKDIYADRGGAHIHFIGIEREYPLHPGLVLEDDALEIKGQPGKLNFYKMGMTRTRFPDRIFYLFILDTCEDIHEGSWNAFQKFIANIKLD